ncbi:MAG: thioredoxin fold domain-containing protein [Thermoguttaceae bacterium]
MRAGSLLLCVAIFNLGAISETSAQSAVRWQSNLEIARRIAGQTNRLVLVHFWSNNCGPCMRMEREVFSRPDVADAIEANFVPVKVNVDYDPDTARRYRVNRWPTDVVLTAAGEMVDQSAGFVDPPQYKARLGQIASRAKMQSMRAYAQIPAAPPPAASPYGNDRVGSPSAPAVPPSYQPAASPSVAGAGPVSVPPSPPYAAQAMSAPPPATDLSGPPAGSWPEPASRQPTGYAAPPWQNPSPPPQPQPAVASRDPGTPSPKPNDPAPGVSAASRVPAGNPPLALEGYCPVTLCEKSRWEKGNPRFGVIHLGRTYLFAGAAEAKRFYNDPERFAPVVSGNDVVLLVEEGRTVSGERKFGGWFEDRMYLFSSELSYQKFEASPARYVAAVKKPTVTTASRSTLLNPPRGDFARNSMSSVRDIDNASSGPPETIPVSRNTGRY